MTLKITGTGITSDETGETGHREDGLRYVTGHPCRASGRSKAVTAMTLVEERSRPAPDQVLIAGLE